MLKPRDAQVKSLMQEGWQAPWLIIYMKKNATGVSFFGNVGAHKQQTSTHHKKYLSLMNSPTESKVSLSYVSLIIYRTVS